MISPRPAPLTDEEQIVLSACLLHYGVYRQFRKLIEESSELILSIEKMIDTGGIDNSAVRVPSSECNKEYALIYNNLCKEIGDVENVLFQVKQTLRMEQIDLIRSRQIERVRKKILLKDKKLKVHIYKDPRSINKFNLVEIPGVVIRGAMNKKKAEKIAGQLSELIGARIVYADPKKYTAWRDSEQDSNLTARIKISKRK